MTQDVVISSALRQNLLSLQNTARVLDRTVLRLATGLKVNSALDNPSSFFTARGLSNEANDLSRLLDGVNQGIQTIKEADVGLNTLTALTRQAETVAQQALELYNQAPPKPITVGTKDITGGPLVNSPDINVNDDVIIRFRKKDETALFGTSSVAVNIEATTTAGELAAQLSALRTTDGEQLVQVELLSNGTLQIEGKNDFILSINFRAAAISDANNLILADALGFGEQAITLIRNSLFGNEAGFDLAGTRTVISHRFVNAAGENAKGSDLLTNLTTPDGSFTFIGLDNAADQFRIGVNGDAQYDVLLDNTQTVQGFVNGINNISALQGRIFAEFDDETGQIRISAIDDTIETLEFGVVGDGIMLANFGFSVGLHLSFVGGVPAEKKIILGQGITPTLTQINRLEDDYDSLTEQIDGISEDAKYLGINLLGGDSLTTFFNSGLTSSLVTEGANFTAQGLGFRTKAGFRSITNTQTDLDIAKNSLSEIRSFQRSVANNLAIIQARQIFIEETINTLRAGSGDLTIADQNKEGANLLALQTREALGVTALSLATQSQQSVLRLF